MKKTDLQKVVTNCVAIARNAWRAEMNDHLDAGDNNRVAIGQISSTLLKEALRQQGLYEIILK